MLDLEIAFAHVTGLLFYVRPPLAHSECVQLYTKTYPNQMGNRRPNEKQKEEDDNYYLLLDPFVHAAIDFQNKSL